MKNSEITRLDLMLPVRSIGTNRRSLTGRVVLGSGNAAGFESSLERDWLICLDFDPDVELILEQPFSLNYEIDGSALRYTPDVLAQYRERNGTIPVVVFEVKPYEELRAEFAKYRQRFKRMVRHCRERSWRFKIVTERDIRTPYLSNAKFLRKYRKLTAQTLYKEQLLYSMKALGPTTAQGLLAMAYLHEEKRMAALTELWRMVANREIKAELDKPLTMHSTIWLGGEHA
ncbi:TnsA endonuclease N-terminal domain-containing protein [Massilia sp. Mn16-1_5]|uniref:TnsA endonuclease N-terminal domain-containing protein n=1 Tax=Massilia sp. Mn16-1_5 TaxID=2079199 RepID=UPI001B349DCB|nr:TnsA endonuclease N-terminal domain-containing protein [Massilia sp. Mn16-1_5]